MIQEVIKNILVYVMITAVLKGLVSNKGFLEIFRFVSGLILILLFTGPLISWFSSGDNWYLRLEENMFQTDYSQVEQQMTVAQGRFEEILQEECQGKVKQQIKRIIRTEGLQHEEIKTEIIRNKEQLIISKIKVIVREKESKKEVVDKIRIEVGKEEKVSLKSDKQTKLLRESICEKFQLEREKVKVWKVSGENG